MIGISALIGLAAVALPLIPRFSGMTGGLVAAAGGFSGLIGTIFKALFDNIVDFAKYLWSGAPVIASNGASLLLVILLVLGAGGTGYVYRNAEVEGYHQNYAKLMKQKKCLAPKPVVTKSWWPF